MLRYMTCCEHPQTTDKKIILPLCGYLFVVMETPKHSTGQQLQFTTCHTFTESHRGLMTPKQESV